MNKDNSPKLQHLKYQSSIFCFHTLKLTYLSILILTELVGSQVIRLLQGMIWSGPLLYSQASSSAVIMLCFRYPHNNIDSASALSRVRVKTGRPSVHRLWLPQVGRAAFVSDHKCCQITPHLTSPLSLTRAGPLTLECCPHHRPPAIGTLNHR